MARKGERKSKEPAAFPDPVRRIPPAGETG